MSVISRIASEIGVPERSLRRAVSEGVVKARRSGPRRLRLNPGEDEYLRSHWPLLIQMREALRHEPNVRIAVLYGSTARGDDDPSSDIDLLVQLEDHDLMKRSALQARLEAKLGREVDIAEFERVVGTDPLLLLQAVDEGRVLADRSGEWKEVRSRRPAIYKRAMRSYQGQMREAADALQKVTGI